MEDKDSDKDVLKNLDVPIEDNLLIELPDIQEALLNSLIISNRYLEACDSNLILEDDRIINDSNNSETVGSGKSLCDSKISNINFSDEGSDTSTSDTDEDASSNCNSQISASAFKFSLGDTNTLSSYFKNLESDVEALCSSMMFPDNSLRGFRNIISNLNYSDEFFSDGNSERSPNDAEFPVHPIKLSFPSITAEDRNRTELALKSSNDPDLAYGNTELDGNLNPLKVSKSSDSVSSSFDSALNLSNSGSEVSQSEFKFPESQEKIVIDEDLTGGNLVNDQGTSASSHGALQNGVFTDSANFEDACNRLEAFICSADPMTDCGDLYKGRNTTQSTTLTLSKPSPTDLKNSNINKEAATAKKSMSTGNVLKYFQDLTQKVENSVSVPGSYNDERTSNCNVEDMDDELDDLEDIFIRLIKCHPIKKFEIPPYAYVDVKNTSGTTVGKTTDPCLKYLQLNDTKEQWNNLEECLSARDSHLTIAFDVTDCFSENSSILCDDLITEYLNIAAKVNFQLIKQIKDTSDQEYELQMRTLHSLEDELGYNSAKLITTINDWVKQFHEINQKFTQRRTYSRGLYLMEILRVCITLAAILLKCSLEKQLELEDYERALVFHHKQSN